MSAPPPGSSSELSTERLAIATDGSPKDDAEDSAILRAYERSLEQHTHYHLGYPYNLSFPHKEVSRFSAFSINNLGDPFRTSNYAVHSRPFELAVLKFFADLWKIDFEDCWGYVTTCGTEGNLHGILTARELHPEGVLYASTESHYSIAKAARFYRMEIVLVPTSETGEIDYVQLAEEMAKRKDKPAIINVNIGTTVKGAVDDLDRILRILHTLSIPRERFYIHCDGALFALMLPFVKFGPEVSFRKPIDSVAVSGHKFLGCPMPCGVVITRRDHIRKVESHIEYLNSVDTTIVGSRNGQAPLFMWYTLRKRGVGALSRDTRHCFTMAHYLRDRLQAAGVSTMLNDLSSTVVMERPESEDFILKWQLACTGTIAHVVVMPSVSQDKLDTFLADFLAQRTRPPCVAEHVGRFCVCADCVASGKSIANVEEDGRLSTVSRAQDALAAAEEELAKVAEEAAAAAAENAATLAAAAAAAAETASGIASIGEEQIDVRAARLASNGHTVGALPADTSA